LPWQIVSSSSFRCPPPPPPPKLVLYAVRTAFNIFHWTHLFYSLAIAEIRQLLANLVFHFDMDIMAEDKQLLDACRV
jgi:hypothetical protein